MGALIATAIMGPDIENNVTYQAFTLLLFLVLVALAFYWKNGKVKVALAVGKGKAQYDKREDLKRRESDRELKRATMQRSRSRSS